MQLAFELAEERCDDCLQVPLGLVVFLERLDEQNGQLDAPFHSEEHLGELELVLMVVRNGLIADDHVGHHEASYLTDKLVAREAVEAQSEVEIEAGADEEADLGVIVDSNQVEVSEGNLIFGSVPENGSRPLINLLEKGN